MATNKQGEDWFRTIVQGMMGAGRELENIWSKNAPDVSSLLAATRAATAPQGPESRADWMMGGMQGPMPTSPIDSSWLAGNTPRFVSEDPPQKEIMRAAAMAEQKKAEVTQQAMRLQEKQVDAQIQATKDSLKLLSKALKPSGSTRAFQGRGNDIYEVGADGSSRLLDRNQKFSKVKMTTSEDRQRSAAVARQIAFLRQLASLNLDGQGRPLKQDNAALKAAQARMDIISKYRNNPKGKGESEWDMLRAAAPDDPGMELIAACLEQQAAAKTGK